jgi:hypothetical protein
MTLLGCCAHPGTKIWKSQTRDWAPCVEMTRPARHGRNRASQRRSIFSELGALAFPILPFPVFRSHRRDCACTFFSNDKEATPASELSRPPPVTENRHVPRVSGWRSFVLRKPRDAARDSASLRSCHTGYCLAQNRCSRNNQYVKSLVFVCSALRNYPDFQPKYPSADTRPLIRDTSKTTFAPSSLTCAPSWYP